MHQPHDGSVEVKDETEGLGCLGLWGSKSRQVLEAVSDGDLSNPAFPYMTARHITVNGASVWAQRISYVGELGWELYIEPEDCLGIWDALMAAGAEYGIQAAGYRALDALRLEKGYLYWSGDITPQDNPFEAGLGAFVCMDKQDFMGRQALSKLNDKGHTSRMMGLILDAGGNLYGGESVYLNDRVVGRIRSGNFGHTIEKDIGLVYLPFDLAKAGTDLEVEVMGARIAARVAELPLVDPAGEKLKI